MSPGPPWIATIPADQWPDELKAEVAKDLKAAEEHPDDGWHAFDREFGDRRTELVVIGRELDHAAATAQLEACCLSEEEMSVGRQSWIALADPFAAAFEAPHGPARGEHGHHDHDHAHGASADKVEQIAVGMVDGSTEASMKGIIDLATEHGVPIDELVGFIFIVVI